jgi:SpoVK/Ycf46/Vps4 family AAA+-type ATPase
MVEEDSVMKGLRALSLVPVAAEPELRALGAGAPAARVAGLSGARQALCELVEWPTRYAAEAAALGVRWPRGLLLHGPPGCGKTLLVQTVAGAWRALCAATLAHT